MSPPPEEPRTGLRTTTRIGLVLALTGVTLIAVGIAADRHGVAVVGFLLLFVVASFVGLTF